MGRNPKQEKEDSGCSEGMECRQTSVELSSKLVHILLENKTDQVFNVPRGTVKYKLNSAAATPAITIK